MLRQSTALALTLAALPAWAEVPRVVVDTAPLHSLVAQVMAGVGTPELILPPGTSPHDFQLRPSDAARLEGAEVVIWMGEGLAPWLADPLATLAPDAATLEMLETEGWTRLALREDAAFAHDHDHDHDHDHGAEEGHDHDHAAEEGHDHDHDHDHDHAAEEGHDHAAEEGHDHAGHDHGGDGTDPHAWLDPAVAAVWLGLIAETLGSADPANASTYSANAAAATEAMAALRSELAATLAPVAGQSFIVPHDAYQYFEVAFGLPAVGAISLSDASAPGPARIAELRDQVAAGNVGCILSDPQTSAEWTEVLREGSIARTAMTDPDATSFAPGPELYAQMMRAMAAALVDCLTPAG